MENFFKDIRYGVRILSKNPGVTLVAVITLALGIGANTAIFSGVSAFLMRPLNVPNAGALIRPMEMAEDRGLTDEFSYPDFIDYRNQSASFTGLAGEDMLQAAIDAENQNDVIWGQVVSANYFDVLEVKPIMGRTFLPDEDKTAGANAVVVLSHSFWQRRLASDPNIVGKSVQLNNRGYQVIGVAPGTFVGTKFALSLDFWTPMSMAEELRRSPDLPHAQYPVSFMSLVARTSGDPAEMIATVRKTVQGLDPEQVPTNVATMEDVMVDSIQTRRFSMFVLGGFAALALCLAAVGIYGVMSYVVAQRTHEIGIRIALGARLGNILRLIVGNALWLAGVGIVLGAVGAFGLTRLMKSLLFGVVPTDLPTFIVVCLSLVVVALVASYLPARRATKVDPLVALRNK